MKKAYYYWIAGAVVILAVAAGLFFWKGKKVATQPEEKSIAEESAEQKIVLRELQSPKADEEIFSEAVRRLAGASFDSLSDQEKLNALVRLADDSVATNRLFAVQRLGELKTTNSDRVDKLIAKLQDENSWVVEAAILTLMELRAPEAVAPLRQLYADLQKQPAVEYVPFANTAIMAVHGRAQSNGEKNDFNFQLAAFAKLETDLPPEFNDREKMALFILPEFEWCLTLPNFKTNWEKLKNSAFAKQLVQLQAWQDFKIAAPFNRYFTLQEKLNSELGAFGGNLNLIEMLGDEIYLAAYEAEENDHTFLVTPANLQTQTMNATLKALGKVRSGDITIEKQTYRGESLFHVYLNNKKASLFRYAVVDGFLVITDDEQMLPRAIASYKDKDENSLAFQSSFRESLRQIDDASFSLAYIDPQKFFDIRKGEQIAEPLAATVEKALQEITGEPIFRAADSLISPPAPISTATAVDQQTLRFIPASAIFCGATTAIPPQPFWHYVTTQRAEKEAIKNFETRSNLNLERDLIKKMDNHLFYFFAGIDTSGPRFFRRHLLGVRLREQKGLENYGKRLLKYLYSPKDGIQTENYAGARIYYVKSPTTFEPNFAVVDHYLLMAFDRTTLKTAIDAGQKRADNIEQNAGFAAARSRIDASENSLLYFNSENFLI